MTILLLNFGGGNHPYYFLSNLPNAANVILGFVILQTLALSNATQVLALPISKTGTMNHNAELVRSLSMEDVVATVTALDPENCVSRDVVTLEVNQ